MANTSPLTRYRDDQTPKLTLEGFGGLWSPPLHKTTVMRWERDGVPLDRVIEVEQRTGIPRHVIRPDVFQPSDDATSDDIHENIRGKSFRHAGISSPGMAADGEGRAAHGDPVRRTS